MNFMFLQWTRDIFIQLITSEAGRKKPNNKIFIQDHWMLLSAQSDIDILCEAAIFYSQTSYWLRIEYLFFSGACFFKHPASHFEKTCKAENLSGSLPAVTCSSINVRHWGTAFVPQIQINPTLQILLSLILCVCASKLRTDLRFGWLYFFCQEQAVQGCSWKLI